jgi:hypothetical protein
MQTMPQETTPQLMIDEVCSWVAEQILARNITAHVDANRARMEHGILVLDIRIEDQMDVGEMAETFQDIEDAWNNQNPRSGPSLILSPKIIRPWHVAGVWHDAHDALDRQKHAIELYHLAEHPEEIAHEFWAARDKYEASLRELERVMPRNGHAA